MNVRNQETLKKRGIIRQILKDHFHRFMEMHGHHLLEGLRSSITETVNKAICCGTRDMGYARYECKGCTKGTPEPVFICFTYKSRFCHGCGKNIWMNGQKSSRNVS
ncbi:transposase zinc-binding domain-containing protein [Paenibacillus sp. IHB B 3415]|uniref:transposase zinc-binding domain-containing protein n=1 Tax=Paenibacillus sp. IHB B 3415 TaxID=867080 RepID=UPI0026910D37